MLDNATKKQFREHNWVEISDSVSNRSQKLRRLKKQANDAISDLSLLASRLPNEEQAEIFTQQNIKKLISSILRGDTSELSEDANFNIRSTRIAALLVREGIDLCIKQYHTKIESNPVFNEHVINHLDKTKEICYEIDFKTRSSSFEISSEKGKLPYLFNWNEIDDIYHVKYQDLRGDTRRFIEVCSMIFKFPIEKVVSIFDSAQDTKCFTLQIYWYSEELLIEGEIEICRSDRLVQITRLENGKKEVVAELPIRFEDDNIYILGNTSG